MPCIDARRLSRLRRTGHVTPANVQFIGVRARCFGEGVANGQVGSHRGTAYPVSGQEAGDCEAGDAAVEILMVESRWCLGMCPTT